MQSRVQQSAEQGDQEDDTIYQENSAYTDYGAQHESLREEKQGKYLVEQQQPRANGSTAYSSSSSSGQTSTNQPRSSPIAIMRSLGVQPALAAGFETDDDDDSVVDVVERDAIRLRQKYGDRVVAVSYQPGMTTEPIISSKSMLKAPYLGSLSKSENFLNFLPPISLSDEDKYKYEEDTPAEIGSYGSLRESHQRGKFLDGPSSYREPRSGQIRRLDPRLRFPAGAGLSSSQQHALSIGERIQQAQKEKETQKLNVKETSDGDATGTSTLSMMMDEASKNPDSQEEDRLSELERIVPIRGATHASSTLGAEDALSYDKFDPPTMMSTSLTAFEILHSTSKSMTEYRTVQRFSQGRQKQDDSLLDTNSRVPSEAKIREQRFHPLSRSLSDPTPRQLQQSPMLSPTVQHLNSPRGDSSLSGATLNPYWANPYGMVDQSTQQASLATAAPDQIHNPDTDAAFDMDME